MLNFTVQQAAWKRQIKLSAKLTLEKGERVHQRAGELLKERVQYYTPVLTGFLRSNWQLQVNQMQIILSNDAPYAVRIENGWSRQAPQGMLKRALLDFPKLLKQAANEMRL